MTHACPRIIYMTGASSAKTTTPTDGQYAGDLVSNADKREMDPNAGVSRAMRESWQVCVRFLTDQSATVWDSEATCIGYTGSCCVSREELPLRLEVGQGRVTVMLVYPRRHLGIVLPTHFIVVLRLDMPRLTTLST